MFRINTDKYTILDGALGTMLQKSGLAAGARSELLVFDEPDLVRGIHSAYIDAGAQVICANTFGANALKLAGSGYSVEEVIGAAVNIARSACQGRGACTALDLGPLGELLEPSGTLSFERAYELYAQAAKAGADAGADLVLLETMTDLYEVKAGVLAVKENTDLPVMVSMSFEENGRTFTGCSIDTMAATVEGLGADALGINCSLGPDEIYPLAKRLCECTDLPVFVKPNAGLPDPLTGEYGVGEKDFCASLLRYHELGICMAGGCCGTTPEYIRLLSQTFEDKAPKARGVRRESVVCSATRAVTMERTAVIGERINPTGKKLFKQALAENNMDYILSQAVLQADAGADILDVNVGMPGIDEADMMERVVKLIQSVTDLPLQIDSSDARAIERALRVYNGKAIVNSVNGERAVLDRILPIVKKYGAAVVGLTLDENGIPPKAEERFAIAQRILEAALSYGIPKEDVYIDCLTLTASAQQAEVSQTLEAVSMVKRRLGLKTVLGVSNISFGLPKRELLGSSFLTLALQMGLDLPIINPNSDAMMDAVRAYRVLYNIDAGAAEYIEYFSNEESAERKVFVPNSHTLEEAVRKGLADEAGALCRALLEKEAPLDVVNDRLIPALDSVGAEFERGTLFLPQLLSAASAAQTAFEAVKEKILQSGEKSVSKGKIVLATVKGDIHDIGKNIVKVILENYGYTVIDLGRDVETDCVVDAVKSHGAPLVGLSALMTTTLGSMENTIKALHEAKLPCKVMVGGAVLTESYAKKIGADFYAKDAKQSADIAKSVFDGAKTV